MNQIDKAALEAEACKLEEELGYENFTEGEDRLGWLMNICSVRTACIHRLTHPSFVRPHPPRDSTLRRLTSQSRALSFLLAVEPHPHAPLSEPAWRQETCEGTAELFTAKRSVCRWLT
jgi:hypothetical protein